MQNQALNTMGGASCAPQQPRQPTQSETQTDQLGSSVQEIRRLVDELDNKLTSVVRQQIPGNQEASKLPPEEYLVPHADMLRAIRKESDIAAVRLRSIIERLEA